MKRARILFTEEYNCQKNKRSQSLFARASLSPSLFCVTAPPSLSLFSFSSSSVSPLTLLSLSSPLSSQLVPLPFYCDSVEKLTRLAGQRIRNYDLSRRRDYLLSRRLWNPGRYSSPAMEEPPPFLSSFFSSPTFPTPGSSSSFFLSLSLSPRFSRVHPHSRSSSVGFSRLSFPGC